jgi:NO-binding membrane sensor protein with MHYT domain
VCFLDGQDRYFGLIHGADHRGPLFNAVHGTGRGREAVDVQGGYVYRRSLIVVSLALGGGGAGVALVCAVRGVSISCVAGPILSSRAGIIGLLSTHVLVTGGDMGEKEQS